MLSVNTFHFAMVGIGLATAAKLQALMAQSVPKAYQIQWVDIHDPQLQGVVIDQMFAEARSIQNIVRQRPISVLKVAREAHRAGVLEHDTLYLPLTDDVALTAWFERHMLGSPAVVPTKATPVASPPCRLDLSVFDQLARPQGMVKLVDAAGEVCLIDTHKQLCWSLRHKAPLYLAQDLRLTYTTHRDLGVQECVHPVDLKTWLWQVLWQSPAYHQALAPHQSLRLLSWPQPQASTARREILRMSAFLQQQPCRIDTLAARTGYELSVVQRFASSLYLAGLAVPEESTDHFSQKLANSDILGWKTLFTKLRRQLGL